MKYTIHKVINNKKAAVVDNIGFGTHLIAQIN